MTHTSQRGNLECCKGIQGTQVAVTLTGGMCKVLAEMGTHRVRMGTELTIKLSLFSGMSQKTSCRIGPKIAKEGVSGVWLDSTLKFAY